MAETLTWTFKGVDLLSGPSRRASSAADDLRRALGGASGGVNGLNTAAAGLASALGNGARAMGALGGAAAGVLAIAGAIGGAFGGVAATIARSAVEMVRFRESAVTTFGVLLGGQGRQSIGRIGGAAFRQTQAVARLTPGNERDINAARQQAITAGFRGEGEERVLAASLDVGALNQGDSTAQGRFVRALGQIRSRGALQAEELNQLGEVGVGRDVIFSALARSRGLTGTDAENTRTIQGLMQRGRITGEEGVGAALSGVRTITGSQLGGFAVSRGGGLAGSMSNLEESLFGLVTGINGLENLPGVRAFAGSVGAIANALNGSSAAGQRLQRSVASIIDTAGGMFAGVFTPARIEGFVTTLANVLPPMFEAFKLVGGAFVQGLGRALGPLIDRLSSFSSDDSQALLAFALSLADAFGYLVGVSVQVVAGIAALGAGLTVVGAEALRLVTGLLNLPAQFGALIGTGWTIIGTRIVDGLVGGISSGVTRVGDAVRGLASGAIATARETLGIASPSRVFAELGGYTAEGYERGIRGGTAGAQDAAAAMVAPPGTAGAGGALGGRGVFQVFIDGAGREADAIVDEIESRMGVGFDRLALSGGEVL